MPRARRSICLLILSTILLLSIYNFLNLTVFNRKFRIARFAYDGELIRIYVSDDRNATVNELEGVTTTAADPVIYHRDAGATVGRRRVDGGRNTKKRKFEKRRKVAAEEEAISGEKFVDAMKPHIFWSQKVVDEMSKRSVENYSLRCQAFRGKVASGVRSVRAASWDKCGRPDNGYAETRDGTPFCVRYRHPHDYLVAGEVLSNHLAFMLGINSPCVVISSTDDLSTHVPSLDAKKLNWLPNVTVALIEWIPNLKTNLRLSSAIIQALVKERPIYSRHVIGKPLQQRVQLAMWSDMIIFDYIIGHHDRYVRLQDDAEKRNDTGTLRHAVPNAGLDPRGALWLFDNEPGLLDAYELLYEPAAAADSARFRRFHRRLLGASCVLSKKLLIAVIRLYQKPDPADYLLERARLAEPNFHRLALERSYQWTKYSRTYFRDRLAEVIAHAKRCSEGEGRIDDTTG